MQWEHSLKLVCPKCLAGGEFVYAAPDFPRREEMEFKSLTAGFTFTYSGRSNTSEIKCRECKVKVN